MINVGNVVDDVVGVGVDDVEAMTLEERGWLAFDQGVLAFEQGVSYEFGEYRDEHDSLEHHRWSLGWAWAAWLREETPVVENEDDDEELAGWMEQFLQEYFELAA